MKKFSYKSMFSLLTFIIGASIAAAVSSTSNYTILGSSSISGMTVTLSGTASANPYTGKSSDQHIAVDWTGACSASSAVEFSFTSINPLGGNNGTFTNATWSTSHTFPTPGTYSVCVKVYHANFSGNEGSSAATFLTSIIIIPTNSLPVAANKTVTTDEDIAAVVTMTATDSDMPANTLTYSIVAVPTHGTLTLLNPATGAVTYTPTLNYNGSDSFTYKVYDGTGYSNTATVSITVNAVNDTPVLTGVAAEYTALELSAFTFTATGNDVEGGALSYSLTGTVPTGASINSSTGVFTWTPTEHQGPADYTFSVRVSDGTLSATKSIIIHVTEVNSAPILATIGNKTGTEDATTTFTISGSDVDVPTQTLSYSATGLPSGATFDTETRTFSWTPAFDQSGTFDVTFTVTDGLLSDSEIVPISIGNVNRSPVLATIGDKAIDEGATSTFTITASDPDGGELSYSATGLPAGATFDTETRTFSWIPAFDQSGTFDVTFTVTDGTNTDTETIVITVNNINRAPVANNQATTTNEDTAVSLTLVATDADLPAQTLTYAIGSPVHGILSAISTSTGAVTYTPNLNYNGSDSFTFTVTDGSAVSNVATVTIAINSVNDMPAIILSGASTVTLTQGSPYTEDGAVCTDAEADGNLEYTTGGVFSTSTVGQYVLTYTCQDFNETSVSVTRTVNIIAPSVVPVGPSFSSGGSSAPAPVVSAPASAPQGEVLGASASCGIYSEKFLRRGYKNDAVAVKKLQKFLNDYMKSGISETGIFDLKTENALKKFQVKHSVKILLPWKISIPTGILYLTTKTEINNLMCPDLKLPIPTNLVPMSKSDIN